MKSLRTTLRCGLLDLMRRTAAAGLFVVAALLPFALPVDSAPDYVNIMLPFDARAAALDSLPSSGWGEVQIQEVWQWAFVRAEGQTVRRTGFLRRRRDGTWQVIFVGRNDPTAAQLASSGVNARRARLLLARCSPTARNTIARARTRTLTFTGMTHAYGRITFASTKLNGIAYSCP